MIDIKGMSKREVLEQIYPDEIEIIFKQHAQQQQLQEIKRYEGYLWSMRAVAAGMGGETKDGKSLYEVYTKELINNIKKLSDIEDDSSSFDVNEAYYEYEKLKNKDNLTVEEEQRKAELKQQLDEHINNEINKLKKIQQKQPT
ncbi:hypothetical protein [Halocella sp. SP3-1]|uniref:hypothetical protein n=1 Tax=Halocella sp. SP3-1 TaxID=2382161 RepID=UPI000F75C1C1|nr:hypothetical protein [Halocella sp. SP3-1]AZO96128.1 hypothetical protein D7D81_16870 [Halocella sp. SP3-1]